jgi:hypothetical protein
MPHASAVSGLQRGSVSGSGGGWCSPGRREACKGPSDSVFSRSVISVNI